MTQPLRAVVSQGPDPRGAGHGWADELECGHHVHFDHTGAKQRRCPTCPAEGTIDQDSLFDDMEAQK